MPVSGVDGAYSSVGTRWDVGSGSIENNGTFDMGGNHWEKTQSTLTQTEGTTSVAGNHVLRGGMYIWPASNGDYDYYGTTDLNIEQAFAGFRVVPFPSLQR